MAIISGRLVVQTQAQSNGSGGRIDAFTFFIPFETDRLDDQFNVGQSTQDLTNVDIQTIISIAIDRGGNRIYYDNWEDGLELNLTNPTQSTTWVWGDGRPANNGPTGTIQGVPNNDILRDGDVITLRNVVQLPRDRGQLFFDGGDVLTSVGGAIAVSMTFWSDRNEGGPAELFTDAWELYPTNRWGTDYIIPIGENLVSPSETPADLGPNQRLGFRVVGINIQAVTNDTRIQIDLNADGQTEEEVTLNEGEQYNRVGTRDGIGPESLLAGARVRSSEPVQVQIFAANPASTYEARGYTLVPVNQWTNDYLAPRSSDGDFWLYNPNDNDLEVRVETSIAGPVNITVPAYRTLKYPEIGLSMATATRFTSTNGQLFYTLAAFDEADAQDWGYSLLPFNRLATQALVGLGLGNSNRPPDGNQSRIYVAATSATTIFVDYNNDGNPDRSINVAPLAEVDIRDPDNDMTGAFLYTEDGTPFAVVWGQDESARPDFPSIDAGTGIVPLPSLLIQKTFKLTVDADCTGTVTRNDTVQFKLQYFNNTANPIRGVVILDNLPPALTYVPNSTILNGAPLADSSSGTPFGLDEGGYQVGDVARLDTGYLAFSARINDDTQPIVNRADAASQDLPLGSDLVFVFTPVQATPPLLQITTTLVDPADGVVSSGQPITLSLVVTNTGASTLNELPVQQAFDPNLLTFLGAGPNPDITASGVITWSDLTNIVGDLPPGAAAGATIWFSVGQLPAQPHTTVFTATVIEATRSDSVTPLTCGASNLINLSTAPPTATPTTPASATPTPTVPVNTATATPSPPGQSTPAPTTTPSLVSVNVPVPTSAVLPVAFLPDTGSKDVLPSNQPQPWLKLILLGIIGMSLVIYLSRWFDRR